MNTVRRSRPEPLHPLRGLRRSQPRIALLGPRSPQSPPVPPDLLCERMLIVVRPGASRRQGTGLRAALTRNYPVTGREGTSPWRTPPMASRGIRLEAPASDLVVPVRREPRAPASRRSRMRWRYLESASLVGSQAAQRTTRCVLCQYPASPARVRRLQRSHHDGKRISGSQSHPPGSRSARLPSASSADDDLAIGGYRPWVPHGTAPDVRFCPLRQV